MEVSSGTADAAVIDYVTGIGSIGEGTNYTNIVMVSGANFADEEDGIAFRKDSDITPEVDVYKRQDLHVHTDNSPNGNHSAMFICEKAELTKLRALAFWDHCEIDSFYQDKYDKRIRSAYYEVAMAQSAFRGKVPVSYTHLDVYKRQILFRTAVRL